MPEPALPTYQSGPEAATDWCCRRAVLACRLSSQNKVDNLLKLLIFLYLTLHIAFDLSTNIARAEESTAGSVAQQNVYIPILGNTASTDLNLVREINDKHVFDPNQAEQDHTAQPAAADITARNPNANIWDKIRASRRMTLTVNPIVKTQMKVYLDNKIWVNKLLKRATPYLQFIVSRLEARGLPLDLALLPAIESGFRPEATSPLNAAGLWQIVPMTGREIGLKHNTWVEERTDLLQSTRGALDYLSYLNAEFHGDWELTLAAYNAGPGRVKNALRKNQSLGLATNFWALRLPEETRAYVPKVTALLELIHLSPQSPLNLPDISNQPVLVLVDVGQRISVDRAAELAELPAAELRRLNAGLRHGVTAPAGPHRLIMPIAQIDAFKRNLSNRGRRNLHSIPRVHVVKAGDSVSTIAHAYGIKQDLLRALNKLKDDKILIGQKLAVLDTHAAQSKLGDHELSYTIKQGDTLSEIAQKFNVKLADITFSSGTPAIDKILIPGKKLRIYVSSDDEKG